MAFPDLQTLVISIPGVIIGFSFHEFAHAWTATRFGDDTPLHQGRVTLNPMAHLDPIGTLLLLFAGFGWAKPVQVNSSRLQPRVLGDIVVSLAGVIMNFLLAILFFFLASLAMAGKLGFTDPVLAQTLRQTGLINVVLVAINVLPVPPLDGFHVLKHIIPNPQLVYTLFRYGPLILILLFVTNLADAIMLPVMEAVMTAIGAIITPLLRAILL